MQTERAVGFWWVRINGQDDHARVLSTGKVMFTSFEPSTVDDPAIEWGPYLGKEPPRVVARDVREACGEVEVSVDGGMTWPIWLPGWQVERAVTMEAKRAAASPCAHEECGEMADVVYENGVGWCRKHRGLVGHFDPSTDYEGEQTRAIDGAGIERAYQRTVEADDEERRAAFVRTGCQGGFDDGWAAGVEWGRRP
jgi:hypothetical protein